MSGSPLGSQRRAAHDILFEPLTIGTKTFRNRFYVVPFSTGYAMDRIQTSAAFRGTQAEGGWACVSVGMCSTRPDSVYQAGTHERLWGNVEDEARLREVVDSIHKHGALATIELGHRGALTGNLDTRWPAVSPSGIPVQNNVSPAYVHIPKVMTKQDIRALQDSWVRGAVEAVELGFDVVCVYAADSHLPSQFFAERTNKRTDEYGGPLKNRARFLVETLAAVREAVSPTALVACRISPDPATLGIPTEDTIELMRLADQHVDLWDVTLGTWAAESGNSRGYAEGANLDWVKRIRPGTDKPIVAVSRWVDPDAMARAVKSGIIDMIGAARPAIADPFLPKKIEGGRYEDIRECTGSNICINRRIVGGHLLCVQNPAAGEEYRRGWHPERFEQIANADRAVLVVGAGPAGLECALTFARRGVANVHLVDSAPEIGGHLRWLSRLPGLGQWGRILDHRQVQLEKLSGVQIILNTELSASDISGYGADLVVLATGSTWAGDGSNYVSGAPIVGIDSSLPWIITPDQLMDRGKLPPGKRIAVYDAEGYVVASSVALHLRNEGYEVDLITPFPAVAPHTDQTFAGDLIRRQLAEAGIPTATRTHLREVNDRSLSFETIGDDTRRLEVDALVLATHRVAREGLYHEVTAPGAVDEGTRVYRVGDCVAPRLLEDAIFDGRRLAIEIDDQDPTLPRLHAVI